MLRNKRKLISKAVGFCNGESIPFARKPENKAIMFFNDGEHFWCHITNEEFCGVFK